MNPLEIPADYVREMTVREYWRLEQQTIGFLAAFLTLDELTILVSPGDGPLDRVAEVVPKSAVIEASFRPATEPRRFVLMDSPS